MKVMRKQKTGMTLVEVMMAMAILIVAILGAMMYRYHSALNARRADVQMGATRIGLLILEGWKGSMGSEDYDPSTLFSSISGITISDEGSDDFHVTLVIFRSL